MLTRLVNWNFNKFLHRSGGLSGSRSSVFRLSGLSVFRLNVFRLNVFRSDGSDESIDANLYNFHSPSIPTNDVLKG
jgi:hypothetical protein